MFLFAYKIAAFVADWWVATSLFFTFEIKARFAKKSLPKNNFKNYNFSSLFYISSACFCLYIKLQLSWLIFESPHVYFPICNQSLFGEKKFVGKQCLLWKLYQNFHFIAEAFYEIFTAVCVEFISARIWKASQFCHFSMSV